MTEILTGSPAKNYIGGEWCDAASGETYEKRNPWRPDQVTGVFPASNADDAQAAIEAAQAAFPGWAGLPAPAARRRLPQGRRRDRGARRADRAGHDRGDGQAAARGAPGGRARSHDPPLLRRRGLAPRRRGVRAVGREPDALHPAAPARGGRSDHAVELSHRDPDLEARPGTDLRQHGRAQARLRGAAHRSPRGRVLRRGRAAARRAQRAHRRRLEGGRRARLEPGRARALVHRLGGRRAERCGTRRPRATAACSSSSAATTR